MFSSASLPNFFFNQSGKNKDMCYIFELFDLYNEIIS